VLQQEQYGFVNRDRGKEENAPGDFKERIDPFADETNSE